MASHRVRISRRGITHLIWLRCSITDSGVVAGKIGCHDNWTWCCVIVLSRLVLSGCGLKDRTRILGIPYTINSGGSRMYCRGLKAGGNDGTFERVVQVFC